MNNQEIIEALEELEQFKNNSKFEVNRQFLTENISKLMKIKESNLNQQKENKPIQIDSKQDKNEEQKDQLIYKPITQYSFDQENKDVMVYIMLDQIDQYKSNIDCDFTKSSFTLKIRNYNGKNLILTVPHLFSEIDEQNSKLVLKKTMVKIVLKKKTSKHWDQLAHKKQIIDDKALNKDNPQDGLMNMMKQLYQVIQLQIINHFDIQKSPLKTNERTFKLFKNNIKKQRIKFIKNPFDTLIKFGKNKNYVFKTNFDIIFKLYQQDGDDNMKKTIAEAWTKSQDENTKKFV